MTHVVALVDYRRQNIMQAVFRATYFVKQVHISPIEYKYSPNKAVRQRDRQTDRLYTTEQHSKKEQQSNSDIVLKGLPNTFSSLSRH